MAMSDGMNDGACDAGGLIDAADEVCQLLTDAEQGHGEMAKGHNMVGDRRA